MVMRDDTWYIVRNIRGVTGFVGPGSKPVPLTEKEIEAWGIDIKRWSKSALTWGQPEDYGRPSRSAFIGTVEEIEADKSRVKLIVHMFRQGDPWSNWSSHRWKSCKTSRKCPFVEEHECVPRHTTLCVWARCTHMATKGDWIYQTADSCGQSRLLPAGGSGPSGQHGVNIMAFTKEFNERTQE